jgi:hypothetical protein
MRANAYRTAFTAAFLLVAAGSTAFAQAQPMTPAPQSPPPGPPPPWAQQGPPWGAPQPLPPPPQPPASAVAPNGEYVAPLAQTTQPVYLPQSVAMSGPRFIKDWEPGNPIPYGYHAETRARKGPIISGSILFGVTYLYSAFAASIGEDVAGSNGNNKAASLYIPVVGPFAELFQSDSATLDYILVLDGIAQATGVILFVYGMSMPKPLLVRNDLAFTVTPMKIGKDGNGFGFVGRF